MYKQKIGNGGYVDFINKSGDDSLIVDSARISYGKENSHHTEEFLVNFLTSLLERGHDTPFEHCSITMDVSVPLIVARQWMRHRTGKYNEVSGRYTEFQCEFYVPDKVRFKANIEWTDELNAQALDIICESYDRAESSYKKLLRMGVARELARLVLPLGMYTKFRCTFDLHNLFHFLDLRLDKHAQKEVRDYAEAVYNTLPKIFPAASVAYRRSRGLDANYEPKTVRYPMLKEEL